MSDNDHEIPQAVNEEVFSDEEVFSLATVSNQQHANNVSHEEFRGWWKKIKVNRSTPMKLVKKCNDKRLVCTSLIFLVIGTSCAMFAPPEVSAQVVDYLTHPNAKYVYKALIFKGPAILGFINRSILPDPCQPNPCFNDFKCTPKSDNDYLCECSILYGGKNCENALPCINNPCLNGGKCQNSDEYSVDYQCLCEPGFTGELCQIEKACEKNPCSNNGKCIDKPAGKFECICQEPYTGEICQNLLPCTQNPCLNGGICVNNGERAECVCRENFTGEKCAVQIKKFENFIQNQAVDEKSVLMGENLLTVDVVTEMKAAMSHEQTKGRVELLDDQVENIVVKLIGKNSPSYGRLKEKIGAHFSLLKNQGIDQQNNYKQFEVNLAHENIGAIWAVFYIDIDASKGIYSLEYLANTLTLKISEQQTIEKPKTHTETKVVYETIKTKKKARTRWFRKDTMNTETRTVPKTVTHEVTTYKTETILKPKLFSASEAQEYLEQWFKFKSLKKAMLDGWEVHSSVKQIVNRKENSEK